MFWPVTQDVIDVTHVIDGDEQSSVINNQRLHSDLQLVNITVCYVIIIHEIFKKLFNFKTCDILDTGPMGKTRTSTLQPHYNAGVGGPLTRTVL